MSENFNVDAEVRLLAQERLLDAVIGVLALRDPDFVNALRNTVMDTSLSRNALPNDKASLIQHVAHRLDAAKAFADAYRGEGG